MMPPFSRGLKRSKVNLQGLSFPHQCQRGIAGRDRLFSVSEEVEDGLATGKPVVALESTIYTHGYPYPQNVSLSSRLESLVRVNGGIPATIGILNGRAHVGMEADQLIELISSAGSENTWKISRRDLGFITGFGLRGQKLNGGTTIAGTMILAHLAGIKIFATGGLGGVHRGGENSMDISADLTELGRTPVAVISSGCKSFLDIPRTLEYLETQGVGVGTFADGREGKVDFPAFFSRDSGVKSPQVIHDEADAAAIVYAQSKLDIQSGLLFANPVPQKSELPKLQIDSIIDQAVAEAAAEGMQGAANTPYVLSRIRKLSKGASDVANLALIEANVIRGTKIAVELAKLELRNGIAPQRSREHEGQIFRHTSERSPNITLDHEKGFKEHNSSYRTTENAASQPQNKTEKVDVLVVGSLASDTICDFAPFNPCGTKPEPVLHTSNPSTILQSSGGVGRNVAIAAHLAGVQVGLASVVADDLAGSSLLHQLSRSGLSTQYVRTLDSSNNARTAQYVAVNNTDKDMVLAMADMSILGSPELESLDYWNSVVKVSNPKWMVVDGNWSSRIISSIITAAKSQNVPIAFEPVSAAKAARFFHPENKSISASMVLPDPAISLATPNTLELTAMFGAAQSSKLFESDQWWNVIDNLRLSGSNSRDKFISTTDVDLVEQGVPQKSIQILPYIPNIVTKLGPKGCLLTMLLRKGDPRLTSTSSAPFILTRNLSDDSPIGGVYMRLFPAQEQVGQSEIVSVNGIGDTMLGVIMAGLVKGNNLDEVIPIAQEAAILTLKSVEAVSPEVQTLRKRLD